MKRIDEIVRGMLIANNPSDYWNNVTFPELENALSIIQQDGESVWAHIMSVMNLLSTKNPVTLLAGLFHDLGKIYTIQTNNSSRSKFLNHEVMSSEIAAERLLEWGANEYLIDQVCRIVSTHMYNISSVSKESAIRKFIANVGQDNIENWFVVRRADSASYSKYGEYKRHIIDPFYRTVRAYLDTLPFEHTPTQLESEPNITIGGKESKSDDISLLTEGG